MEQSLAKTQTTPHNPHNTSSTRAHRAQRARQHTCKRDPLADTEPTILLSFSAFLGAFLLNARVIMGTLAIGFETLSIAHGSKLT